MGVESGGGTGGRVPRSLKISGGRPSRNDDISVSFFGIGNIPASTVANLEAFLIQTEAERRRREAGVKQSDLGHVCGWVGGYVWYLELSREPKHVAQ